MKRIAMALVLFSSIFTMSGRLGAGDKPIVAVFNVETKMLKLSRDFLDGLGDHLSTLLTEKGNYQVVPRSELKKRLIAQKQSSHKLCYDQSCQIAMGKELAAEKTLSAQVMKLGSKCKVNLTMFDLKKAATESAASQSGKCDADSIVESMELAVTKLVGGSTSTAVSTPVPKQPDPVHDTAARKEASKPPESSGKDETTASLGSGGIWQRALQAETASKDWVRTISMTYRDSKGNDRVLKLREFRLGRDKQLFRFTDPADVKGMAVLSGGPGKTFVYLPAFRKVRRLASHVASQGFMGSDYSYMDVIRNSWLSQLTVERTQEGSDHYILDLKAQSPAGAVYSKVQAKIRKEDSLIERLVFFGRSGARSKVLTRSQCRKQGRYAHCFQEEMKDMKRGSVTRLTVESLITDTNLKEKIFTQRALMKR